VSGIAGGWEFMDGILDLRPVVKLRCQRYADVPQDLGVELPAKRGGFRKLHFSGIGELELSEIPTFSDLASNALIETVPRARSRFKNVLLCLRLSPKDAISCGGDLS
jgi:hypothetical protein